VHFGCIDYSKDVLSIFYIAGIKADFRSPARLPQSPVRTKVYVRYQWILTWLTFSRRQLCRPCAHSHTHHPAACLCKLIYLLDAFIDVSVSTFVIDCIAIGQPQPIRTEPIKTVFVFLRLS